MKFSLALFATYVAGVSAIQRIPTDGSIKADSLLGSKLLSKARNLEQDGAEEFSWVAGYSLKFQGCHHVKQWNADADDANDVKIATKRLVRFRLCPSDSCSAQKAGGCTGGYGDYVVDMNTYVDAYYEAKKNSDEQACEYYMTYNCDCEDDDGKGDDFDRDICEYDCFAAASMTNMCSDQNPYEDDEGEKFEVENYMECAQLEGYDQQDEDAEDRKLEEGEEDEDALYVGPYCAEQGGAIYLGVFNDDTCSEFADEYGGKTTFMELTGQALPYSSESLVGAECVSCVEQDNEDEENGDEDRVGEQCEQIYIAAGKCESNLPSGMVDEPNNGACTYMEGIKIARADGIMSVTFSKRNPVVTAFNVIFAMSFLALGFYVFYLRKRLGVKKNALL
jgi:hypothetical protein